MAYNHDNVLGQFIIFFTYFSFIALELSKVVIYCTYVCSPPLFGFSVGKGRIGYPCLTGNACADYNAECKNGICLCRENFYEKDGKCGE